MRRFWRNLTLFAPFMAMALSVVCWVQCRVSPLPLDYWNIPELVEQLNRGGVEVRTVAVKKEGPHEQSAYLTTTDRDWHYLNKLVKDPKRIHEWRGIVYCERLAPRAPAPCLPECEHCSLEVGPFYFFGDTELLARIGSVLGQPDFRSRSDAGDVLPPTFTSLARQA